MEFLMLFTGVEESRILRLVSLVIISIGRRRLCLNLFCLP